MRAAMSVLSAYRSRNSRFMQSKRFHLLVALGGIAAGRRIQVRDRHRAGLKRRGRVGGAQVAAGQLHGRRGAADVDEGRQILVAGAERIGDPAAEGRMVERAAAMAGLGFDDGGKVIAFVAPHRADDGDVVDHAADVREPVGDRHAGLAVMLEGAQAGNDRTLHLRDVVAEADGVDQLAGVLVVLGVEGVDVADAAAHEKEDDRFGFFIAGQTRVELSILGPKRAQRRPEERPLIDEHMAARNLAARIKILISHDYYWT